jgi:hypothetical protein
MYEEDGNEHISHPHPDIDDIASEGFMDMDSSNFSHEGHHDDQLDQVLDENDDAQSLEEEKQNQAWHEIPYEYEVRNVSSLPRDGVSAELIKRSIPYENDEVCDSRFFRKQEERPHHILFEIPYEDGKIKLVVRNMDFDTRGHQTDIPYEHDTVTTSSESSTHGGESTEVDDVVHEIKSDLGSTPSKMDDSDDALRTLFDSLGDCQPKPGMNNDNSEWINEEHRRDAALTDMLSSLNEADALQEPNTCSFVGNVVGDHDMTTVYENGDDDDEEEEEEYIEECELGWLPGFTVNVEARHTPHLGVNQYGIFALQDIPAKHLVWKWTTRLQAYHYSELDAYIQANYHEDDLEGIRTFLRRGVVQRAPSDSHFISALTDSIGFMNCSATPNCRHQRATRYIYKGEELTLDYSFYSNPQWYVEFCHKYGIMTGLEIAERQSKFGDDRYFSADYVGDNDSAEKDAWLAHYLSQVG